MSTMTQQQAAPAPGQFFDVPGAPGGETQWLEEYEPTQTLGVALQSGAQVQAQGIMPFKQTDVVLDWVIENNITQAYTAGTSTLTNSAYAPHNVIGPVKLTIQNQYASVDVESGIDLFIFNLIRPERDTAGWVNMGAGVAGFFAGSTALGYPAAANAQANLTWPAQWTNALATYNLFYRIPAGQWFDVYYDRAVTGEPVSPPHSAIVSPQMMAGTTRVITPTVKYNQGNGSSLDVGPVNIGTGTGTYTGSTSLTFRRKGIYAGNPAVLPPVYAWQYRWKTDRFSIAGVSRFDLQVPLDAGQILSVYVRLWDPTAAAGLGGPIQISALSLIALRFGSGLNRWTGTPQEWQERWYRQHGFALPPGVFCFDLAYDERGLITNKRVLNTLTTSGVLVHMEWPSPTSASAYAVLGTESLVYVT
jgi:hypothetical protein